MSVLGIGGPELILVIILVILILGPERAPQAARAIGRQWRAITRAEWWQSAVQMWYFVRHLPENLAEFAEIKEMRSSLSDELTQVRNLTQSVQEEVESVSKPVQAVLKGNALQSTLQEVGNELKQSVPQAEGPASTKPGADEAPSAPAAPAATSQPPVPAEAPSSTTTPPTATRPSVPPPSLGLGEAVDKQVMAMAEELSEQIEQLPEALTRLGELESQQAEIASRLERMQQRLDALLMEQRDQATDDTAHSEIPALDE